MFTFISDFTMIITITVEISLFPSFFFSPYSIL